MGRPINLNLRGKKGRFVSRNPRYIVWEDQSLLLHLWVPGQPRPWCSPVMARRGGEVKTPRRQAMKEWQAEIRKAVALAKEYGTRYKLPLDGALSARAVFYLPQPKTRKRSEVWAETYADLDNMVKAAMDALQQAEAVVNDARITELYAAKVWATQGQVPGVRLELRRPPANLSHTCAQNFVHTRED